MYQRKERKPRIPKYSEHKSTGRAFVRIKGVWITLGKFNSPESRSLYDKVIAEWLSNGRVLPPEQKTSETTVAEGISAYWGYLNRYYPDDRERSHFKRALGFV